MIYDYLFGETLNEFQPLTTYLLIIEKEQKMKKNLIK